MTGDDELRRLLSDAVSDIEPEDRLVEIRASVRSDPKVVPMSRARSWRYAATGIVATAAVIGVVAYVTTVAGNDPDTLAPSGHGGTSGPTATATATDSSLPSTPPTSSATPAGTGTPAPGTKAFAVYYVGDDPHGRPVLFREFHRGAASTPPGTLAEQGLQSDPLDPDYTTPWRAGDLRDAKANPDAGVIFVTPAASVTHGRPASMSAAYAEAAIQQVVYTLQAAFQTRMPVLFVRHGTPVGQVLGVPTSEPVTQGKVLSTLSLVNISSPNEGDQLSGRITVTGVNNSFEGTSVIYLERAGKRFLVTPTIGGMGLHRLFPWTVKLDLSKVRPGTYTLVAQNDDPSGMGKPVPVDTRVIEVK